MKAPFLTLILGVVASVILLSCNATDPSPTATVLNKDAALSAQGGGGGAPSTPPISTGSPLYITSASATIGGTVNTGGTKIIQRGVCYSTAINPTTSNSVVVNGSGEGSFECVLFNLPANTTYYARAFSVHSKNGTSYGSQVSFTTKQSYGTVTDADGNEYTTITIGTQVWTVENLRTTSYRDGSSIHAYADSLDWLQSVEGAYCSYGNNDNNVATYGRLYNFYAITDSRNIAPSGWHVPTRSEWLVLSDYLGGQNVAGGRVKSTGTSLWLTPNTGATNAASFFAVPNGSRSIGYNQSTGLAVAYFTGMTTKSPFWTSTTNSSGAWSMECSSSTTSIERNSYIGDVYDLRNGYAIRLVKD